MRTWTDQETHTLKTILLAGGSYEEAARHIPDKSKRAIYQKAEQLGIRSKPKGSGRKVERVNPDNPVLNKIDAMRVRMGLSTTEFSRKAGYTASQWHLIVRGKANPSFRCVTDFAEVAGVKLEARVIAPKNFHY